MPIAEVAGKLAWKVDWPMRWAYERVTFEPAGVDHSSPGSSFTVGGELVTEIFGGEMPLHFGYAFVGTTGGSSKMSGSAGGAPTPADALEIFEAPLLRWLYARRRPEQSITLAFDAEVGRVYDEWDALSRKVADRHRRPAFRGGVRPRGRDRRGPAAGHAAAAAVPDAGLGGGHHGGRRGSDPAHPAGPDRQDPVASLDEVRPRLDCAQAWVAGYMDPADRTQVRPGRTRPGSRPSARRNAARSSC